ncbi:hypothetical protein ACVLVH_004747, partial [Kluyvera sp. 1366]
GSVGPPHARVGNCQASNSEEAPDESPGLFYVYTLAISHQK